MLTKFFSLLFILGFLSLPNCTLSEEIRVGVMTHLSGDFAAWGKAYIEGVSLAQKQINESGGIQGREISLIVEDTRFDSKMTATVASKLLNIDKVPIALVSTFTEVMVAGPMFEKAKVPLVVFGDSGNKIDDLGNYIFSTGTWVDGFALSASKFLYDVKKIRSVALVTTNNAWSQSTAYQFTEDFKRRGGEIVVRYDLNPSESDFRTFFTRLREQSIEAIFAPITSNVVAFFKQAHNFGIKKPIITAGGALDKDVIEAAPVASEGRYVTNAFLDSKRLQAQNFLSLYKKEHGSDPKYPSVTARGYDGLMAVQHALGAVSEIDSEFLKEALYQLDFEAAGFHLKMSPEGSARLPVAVLRVKNGCLEKVGDV